MSRETELDEQDPIDDEVESEASEDENEEHQDPESSFDSEESEPEPETEPAPNQQQATIQSAIRVPHVIGNVRWLLDKVRSLVKMARASGIIFSAVSTWAAEQKLRNSSLILDYRIRWNSTYTMLVRFLEFRLLVNYTTSGMKIDGLTDKQERKLDKLKLSKEDWELIEALVVILEPIHEATKIISGRNYSTLSLGKGLENIMFNAYEKIMANHDADSNVFLLARAITDKMTTYLRIKQSPEQNLKSLVSH